MTLFCFLSYMFLNCPICEKKAKNILAYVFKVLHLFSLPGMQGNRQYGVFSNFKEKIALVKLNIKTASSTLRRVNDGSSGEFCQHLSCLLLPQWLYAY